MCKLLFFSLSLLTAVAVRAQLTCNIVQNDTTICRGSAITLSVDTTLSGVACTSTSLPTSLQNGLVAFYPFCGNANDQSGNANHGTVVGALLTTDRFGVANSAYSFNGNEYIIGSASSFPTGTRTVSLWFYATNIGVNLPGPTLLGYGGGNCGTSWFETIDNPGTPMGQNNTYQVQGHCNNESVLYDYGAVHPNNAWHHWVITTSPAGTKFYIDGVMVVNDTTFINETYVQDKDFIFGGPVGVNGLGFYTDGNIYGLQGKLDDIFIYNRELSSDEVALLYQSQIITWSTGESTPSITVTPLQTTTFYVTVTDSISICTDSVTITISNVDTSITALDPTSICSNNDSVRLRAGLGSSYQWLHDSVPLPGATARDFAATQSGSYRVIVADSLGCTDTSRAIAVNVYPLPVPDFTVNDVTQCLNANLYLFTNNSSISSGSLTYLWEFGDGATASSANSSHIYTNPGGFDVKLIATSNNGCKDSLIKNITVFPSPSASFTINNPAQCQNTNSFVFTNTSSISSGSMTFSWDFGDGNGAASTNTTHTYLASGNYTATLIATSNNGCSDTASLNISVYAQPALSFSINNSVQCINNNSFLFTNTSTIANGSMTFAWDFGDGNTASTTNASHSYSAAGTYIVRLVAVSNNNCSDSITQTVTVNPKPVVSYTINNMAQCENGNNYIFTNTSTISSGSMTFVWHFGDGNTATTGNATHTYAAAGTYTVKLVAVSNNGCKDSLLQNVTVYPKPNVSFGINNANQCITGNNFAFTNTSTIAAGSMSFLWNFGDGITASTFNANHSYSATGAYAVKLVAVSNNGCRDSITQNVAVSPGPASDFTINNSSQCLSGNSFSFTNTTIPAGTMSYLWNFGDGTTAATVNALHTYSLAGNYNVKLVSSSNNGCKDSIIKQVTVFPQPQVPLVTPAGPVTLCEGNSVTLTTTAAPALQWYNNSAPIPGATMPGFGTSQAGSYTVSSTNASGCSTASAPVSVTVHTFPNGTLQNPSQNFICAGSAVILTASGAFSYQWYRNGNPITGATGANYNAVQAGIYSVEFISAEGCRRMSSNSITLTLVNYPRTNFNYTFYCENIPVIFSNNTDTSGSGTVNYNWYFGDGGTSSLNNPAHIYTTAATYTAKLVAASVQCPQVKDSTVKIIKIEKPQPGIKYIPVNVILNTTIQLSARPIGNAYLWTPSIYLNNPSLRNPDVTPMQDLTYTVMITSASGCVTVDTQLVRVFKESNIYVPEGFSPNGDGKNDLLMPILVGIKELKYFKVYNRWGQLLYQTNKAGEGWDGNYKGTKQPIETYSWIAEAVDIYGETIKRAGSTILLR